MTEHLCVACPQLRNGEPRVYDRPNVCEGCRSRLRSMLSEVVELYAELLASYRDIAPVTTSGTPWEYTDYEGKVHRGLQLDPVAVAVPAGPTKDQSGDHVTGSRSAPIPVSATTVDLTLGPAPKTVEDDLVPLYERAEVTVAVYRPTNPRTVQATYPKDEVVLTQRRRKRDADGWLAYGPSTDQVGDPSVPAVLDSWARDWQGYRWAILPDPSVSALSQWLLDRLEWACDTHPAIDDFASELAECTARLRPRGPKVELKTGVPCRDCEIVSLFRWPGSDYVECGSCPALLTPEEYQRWTQLLATPEHQPWVRSIVEPQRPTGNIAS